MELIKKELKNLKDNFEKDITELITGQNAEKLSEIKNYQDEIISLSTEKQVLINKINEERLQASSGRERIRLLGDQLINVDRETTDIAAKLAKASVKFDAEKINQEKQIITKSAETISAEISEIEKIFTPWKDIMKNKMLLPKLTKLA